MLRAAIVGLGWWGGTLVDAVEGSDLIAFRAAATRSRSPADEAFAAERGLKLTDYADLLTDPDVDAVVLATPPSGHHEQILAAASAGKHVFCEKPFTTSRASAEMLATAMRWAGCTLGLGYNRRFHPSWIDLKHRILAGELGTILHAECTMSGPNGLTMPSTAWRAQPDEAPLGGLMPMGVHAIDGLIDLFGEVETVFCQSGHRAAPSGADDTTSVLFQMRAGMTAYLGVMMATAPSFRFQVYGACAAATLGGAVHVAGQSSRTRRAGLFGTYVIQPVGGDAERIETPEFDVNRAELEAFARAALGGDAFPIPEAQMIHGVAVTDAIIASARSGRRESVA